MLLIENDRFLQIISDVFVFTIFLNTLMLQIKNHNVCNLYFSRNWLIIKQFWNPCGEK